jgi:hypothetical protein
MNRDRVAKAPEALDPSIWHPELLAGPLRSKRLTVLYGPPGPLRDGMLRRGLMPLLRQSAPNAQGRARRRQVPIRFDGWGPLPLQALRTRIDAEFTAVWPQGAPETLAAHLRAIGRTHHATVLLVLDAFERHLGERAERHDIERFDIELSECITHEAVPLHVLMVVDELENRALQRYTRWIADFGDDFVRLPSLLSGEHDAAAWRDTDIVAPPESADDDPAADDGETDTDWPVDLLLDAPPPVKPPAPPVSTEAPTQPPPQPPPPAMAPQPAPAVAPPTVAPRPFSAFEPLPAGETRHGQATPSAPAPRAADGGAPHAAPARRVEPTFGDEAPGALPRAPGPAPPPRAAPASQAPFGEWPPLAPPEPAPTPAVAPRSAPPWLSEADVAQMRRLHEQPSRWPGLLGLALYMVALLGGAWWVASWIIDSQRVETRPRAPDNAPGAQSPAPTPAPGPNAPTAAAPQGAAPAPSPTTPAAPVTTSRTLTLALPADAGSALPLVDELIRRVAAPAGLELRTAAGNEPASLALLRTDALLEARATSAAPLQVVAPLYSEQIQVLVRNDARWDYVREIRGLRLNIGRADGARARTARALYQQLFGTPLPAAQANELELDAALQALQQRGGPIDAVFVISDAPIVSHMQPALRKQVRELTISARDASAVTAMPAFTISRRTASDRARLATTTYLVAPGAPPRPQDAALRQLAAALCRAQPALQTQNSALLRGWRQGQQPDVGWPYVLPRTPNAACPAP